MSIDPLSIVTGEAYHYRHAGKGVDGPVTITSVTRRSAGDKREHVHVKGLLEDGRNITLSVSKLHELGVPELSEMHQHYLPEVAQAMETIDAEWWDKAGAPKKVVVSTKEFEHYADDETSINFANRSELDFARRIDAAGIAWQHEPQLFVFERPEGSKAPQAFLPDIYLPETDMYIELTTSATGSKSGKNIKLRSMNTQYPSERVLMVSRPLFATLMQTDDIPTMIDRLYEHQQIRLGLAEPTAEMAL